MNELRTFKSFPTYVKPGLRSQVLPTDQSSSRTLAWVEEGHNHSNETALKQKQPGPGRSLVQNAVSLKRKQPRPGRSLLQNTVSILAPFTFLCWVLTVKGDLYHLISLGQSPTERQLSEFRSWDRPFHPSKFGTLERSYPRQVQLQATEFPIVPKSDPRVLFFFPEKKKTRALSSKIKVIPMISEQRKKRIADSDDYDRADPLDHDNCKHQHSWQLDQKPTCNAIHEIDILLPYDLTKDTRPLIRHVASGGFRDVWVMEPTDYDRRIVLKTSLMEHDFTERNYDRNRRDAMVLEHLSSSPFVLDIYGFCANSAVNQYAPGGTVEDRIWPGNEEPRKMGKTEISLDFLRYAYQSTLGLAAVHNTDVEGRPAVAHTDLGPSQFLVIDDKVKINDFNRARFLSWDPETREICPFTVGNNVGKNRAPEEYAYEPETEKIDIYSLGNLFYMLVTRHWPFEQQHEKNTFKLIMKGERPFVAPEFRNSTNPIHITLLEAMRMCHDQDPKKRATAREIQHFLEKKIEEIAPGKEREWGP